MFFAWHPWLYLFLVPAVGMRMWSEERRLGTIELLLTMPITPWQAIVGKFLASWLVLALALALTFPIVITVNYLGNPDNGVILASYLRQPAAFRRLPVGLGHDFRDDAQPGGQLHCFGGALPLSHSRRLAAGHRSAVRNGPVPGSSKPIAAFSVMTHFEASKKA